MRIEGSKSERFYLIGYILFLILRVINNSMLQFKVPKSTTFVIHWVIIGLLLCSFFFKRKISKKNIYLIASLSAVSIIVYLFNPNVDFLCIIFLAVLAPMIDYNRIIKTTIVVNSIMILAIIILCKIGVIEDLLYRHVSFAGISYAHSYGFVYYSTVQFMICFLSCMVLYYYRNKHTYILLTILNLVSYVIFTAILPLVSYVIMLLLSLASYRTKFIKFNRWWIIYLPVIFSFMSIVSSLVYSPNSFFLSFLNKILNTRISQAREGLIKYGLTLFGQPIEMNGTYKVTYAWKDGISNFFIDNDYIYILLSYGVVFYIAILIIYCFMLRRFIDCGNHSLVIWTMTTVIFAFVNSTLVSVDFNPILLVGINQLFSKRNIQADNEDQGRIQNNKRMKSKNEIRHILRIK